MYVNLYVKRFKHNHRFAHDWLIWLIRRLTSVNAQIWLFGMAARRDSSSVSNIVSQKSRKQHLNVSHNNTGVRHMLSDSDTSHFLTLNVGAFTPSEPAHRSSDNLCDNP